MVNFVRNNVAASISMNQWVRLAPGRAKIEETLAGLGRGC